jgi:hypothetical protein
VVSPDCWFPIPLTSRKHRRGLGDPEPAGEGDIEMEYFSYGF